MDMPGLAEALTLIYDPVKANLRTTRGALNSIGFRRIEGFTEIKDFYHRLKDQDTALVMIELMGAETNVPELIQAIRRGDRGGNPFVPIIATSWSGHSEAVAELMNSGADDVLLRPFSIATMTERVKALVTARKDFVITSDYIGPDRGKMGANSVAPGQFSPPNALRARVMNPDGLNMLEEAKELAEAKRRMSRDRVARLARRVAMAAEVTIQAAGKGGSPSYVADMLETCAELIRAARSAEAEEIDDLASVLERTATRAAVPGEEQASNAQLTRELALALYLAYAAEEATSFQKELDETLSMVRERLEKARERAQRRSMMALLG